MKKLHLGCGNDIKEGYVNVDLTRHRKEVEFAFDLSTDRGVWHDEIRNGEWDEIFASDVIEHLDDTVKFMDDMWELLAKDGVLSLKACGWQNPNYYVDPTHKHAFDIRSFDYFDPDTELGKEYGYYSDKRWNILDKNFDRRKNVLIKLTPRK